MARLTRIGLVVLGPLVVCTVWALGPVAWVTVIVVAGRRIRRPA